MNINMLISKMKLFGDRQEDLAKALGHRSLSTTNAKINGKRKWTQDEITIIKNRYNLTPEDVDQIFFNHSVHQEGTDVREP